MERSKLIKDMQFIYWLCRRYKLCHSTVINRIKRHVPLSFKFKPIMATDWKSFIGVTLDEFATKLGISKEAARQKCLRFMVREVRLAEDKRKAGR